jgi:3-oxoacyl-[acyl-carrier protein] reductase
MLNKKIILVTGAAGGIGSAVCRRMADAGARVVLLYRNNADGARALMQSLALGEHVMLQGDVTDSASLARAANAIHEKLGRLDVLVNNAGVTRQVPHADLDALDDALIDQIFQTNWRGAFACVRAFKDLLEAGAGTSSVVVNISSVAGQIGLGSNVAYCASKAALDSMTRSLARALAPRIRVVSVSPGWVLGEYASKMDPAMIATQREKTPLGKLSSAEDVAEAVYAAVYHLPQSTGCIIPVDGGRPLG